MIWSPRKLAYAVLGAMCLLIGIVGLVIPIIPGLLFLAGAVFLFSKVSRRVNAWSKRQPLFQDVRFKLARMAQVGPMDRVRVSALLMLDVVVRGLDRLTSRLRRLRSRAPTA
jgi:uncharacterized membrane protein YbaN (DUF454 family)